MCPIPGVGRNITLPSLKCSLPLLLMLAELYATMEVLNTLQWMLWVPRKLKRHILLWGKGKKEIGTSSSSQLTNPPFLRQESPGDELNTYSTMLTPSPPLSDRGDSTELTSLFTWKLWPGLLCTMIGWETEWSTKKIHKYDTVQPEDQTNYEWCLMD